MRKIRSIGTCTRQFRYRVPPASRGRQEPPQAVEFLPWDALGPQVRGVPGGQALRYGTRAPAHSKALNAPCNSRRQETRQGTQARPHSSTGGRAGASS